MDIIIIIIIILYICHLIYCQAEAPHIYGLYAQSQGIVLVWYGPKACFGSREAGGAGLLNILSSRGTAFQHTHES